MNKEQITPKAIVQNSNGAVRELIKGDKNAIGFISLGLVDIPRAGEVKALKLGGVTASRENVTNGSYSLFRPFLFVSNAEPHGLSKDFIDFTLSEEGQRLLVHEGLISAAEGEAQ